MALGGVSPGLGWWKDLCAVREGVGVLEGS